jgi:hypothetical protein
MDTSTSTGMMKCPRLGVAIAVLLFACMPLAHAQAQTQAQDAAERSEEPASMAAKPTTAPRPFDELDQNADGAISKDEAAVDPPLAQVFGTLDKDADGRLSPEEYAVHTQGTP